MIRTVIAASSAIARAGLAAVLRGDSRVFVVGETTPSGLSEVITALAPDVVIEQRDEPNEGLHFETVPDGSAHALISRDANAEQIVAALVAVAAGLVVTQPRAFANGPAAGMARDTAGERLSPREVDVLNRLAQGASNKQIATALAISEHTVKFHITSIFAKLGVSSRTEAVTVGVRRGLIML